MAIVKASCASGRLVHAARVIMFSIFFPLLLGPLTEAAAFEQTAWPEGSILKVLKYEDFRPVKTFLWNDLLSMSGLVKPKLPYEEIWNTTHVYRFVFGDENEDQVWISRDAGRHWELVHRGKIDGIYMARDSKSLDYEGFFSQLPRGKKALLHEIADDGFAPTNFYLHSGDKLIRVETYASFALPWLGEKFFCRMLDRGNLIVTASLKGTYGEGMFALLSTDKWQSALMPTVNEVSGRPYSSMGSNFAKPLPLLRRAIYQKIEPLIGNGQVYFPRFGRTVLLTDWDVARQQPADERDVYGLWLEDLSVNGHGDDYMTALNLPITPDLIQKLKARYGAMAAPGVAPALAKRLRPEVSPSEVLPTVLMTVATVPAVESTAGKLQSETAVAPPPPANDLASAPIASEAMRLLGTPVLRSHLMDAQDGHRQSLDEFIRRNFNIITEVPAHYPEEEAYFAREIEEAMVGMGTVKGGSVRITGRPGTGKTHFMDVLVSKVMAPDSPDWLKNRIYIRLRGTDLASGRGVIGPYEEKVKALQLLSNYVPITLVIDEMQGMVGSGQHRDRPTDFFGDMLTHLESGRIRFIGTITDLDWQTHYGKNQPLNERAQTNIVIGEPDEGKLIEIMGRFADRHYDAAGIRNAAAPTLLKRILQIATQFNPIGANPRKALNLLDYSLSYGRHLKESELTEEKIERFASSLYGYDVSSLSPEKLSVRLSHFMSTLDDLLVGMKSSKQILYNNLAGYFYLALSKSSNRPFFAILAGERGVGKTTLAAVTGRALGYGYKKIPMSAYKTSFSVDDFKSFLALTVRTNPYQVVLLDEIEKSHPDVQDSLLQIMDDGRFEARLSTIRDDGVSLAEIDASKVIFMASTNAGKSRVERGRHNRAEFDREAERDGLNPYLINRADVYIPVHSPQGEDVVEILRRKAYELQEKIAARHGRRLEVDRDLLAGLWRSYRLNNGREHSAVGFASARREGADKDQIQGDSGGEPVSIRNLEREILNLQNSVAVFFLAHHEVTGVVAQFRAGAWEVREAESEREEVGSPGDVFSARVDDCAEGLRH